jgi:hypothetical protein
LAFYTDEKKEPNGLFRRIQNRVSLLTLFGVCLVIPANGEGVLLVILGNKGRFDRKEKKNKQLTVLEIAKNVLRNVGGRERGEICYFLYKDIWNCLRVFGVSLSLGESSCVYISTSRTPPIGHPLGSLVIIIVIIIWKKKIFFQHGRGFFFYFSRKIKSSDRLLVRHMFSHSRSFFYFIFFKKKLSSVKYDFLGCGTYLTQARKEEEEDD